MKTLDTPQIGTIYTLTLAEAETQIDLGPEVTLHYTVVAQHRGAVRYRSWYVQGYGMIDFEGDDCDENTTLEACNRWLAANGYAAQDTMPPGCFEYRKVAAPVAASAEKGKTK